MSLHDQWKPTDRDGITWERTCDGTGNWQGTREGRTPASLNISELCLEAMLRGDKCTFDGDGCECHTVAVRHAFGMPCDTPSVKGWRYHSGLCSWFARGEGGGEYELYPTLVERVLYGDRRQWNIDSFNRMRECWGLPLVETDNPLTIDGITPVETERLTGWLRACRGWWVTVQHSATHRKRRFIRHEWVADLAACRVPEGLPDELRGIPTSQWCKAFGRSPAEQPLKPEPIRRCAICKTEGDAVTCPEGHPDLRELCSHPRTRPWVQMGGAVTWATWDPRAGSVVVELGGRRMSVFAWMLPKLVGDTLQGLWTPSTADALLMALFEPPDVPDPPRSRHPRRPTPWDPEAM